ncbi:MAG: peptidoglycan-binding domain-containing protein, partial [Ilumatobacteraceae bacterium]
MVIRSRRWWSAGVIGLVAVAAVSVWLGSRVQSSDQAAARATEPEASWVTAPVELRVLAATVVVRGDVRPEVSLVVSAPASVEGGAVVTGLPVAQGDTVPEGTRVVEVSGRPVFVLQGDVPVYRALRPGMSGPDVAQLQASLVRLGYQPDADGVFGELTKQAVAGFYASAGYTPVPTSATATADLAASKRAYEDAVASAAAAQAALTAAGKGNTASTIAQAQTAVSSAQRAVDAANAKLITDTADAQATLDAATTDYNLKAADPTVSAADLATAKAVMTQAKSAYDTVRRDGQAAIDTANENLWVASLALNEARKPADVTAATTARDSAKAAADAAALSYLATVSASGPTVAQGEVVFVTTMPARVQAAVTTLGPVAAAGGTDGGTAGSGGLVTLAGGALVISTSIRSGDLGLVRTGMPVTLLDETTNTSYPATITSVAEQPVVGPDGQLGTPAVVAADAPLPEALAGVNLRVTITTAATDGEVLVVP